MKIRVPKELRKRIGEKIQQYHELFKHEDAKAFLSEFQDEYYDFTMSSARDDFYRGYSKMFEEVVQTIYLVERFMKCRDEMECRNDCSENKTSPLTKKIIEMREDIEDYLGVSASDDDIK